MLFIIKQIKLIRIGQILCFSFFRLDVSNIRDALDNDSLISGRSYLKLMIAIRAIWSSDAFSFFRKFSVSFLQWTVKKRDDNVFF